MPAIKLPVNKPKDPLTYTPTGKLRTDRGKRKSIGKMLLELGDEVCPPELMTYYRKTFPCVGNLTMREAWLRVIYMEALSGQSWASYFIAERTEGRVTEGVKDDSKGLLLDAIDELVKD